LYQVIASWCFRRVLTRIREMCRLRHACNTLCPWKICGPVALDENEEQKTLMGYSILSDRLALLRFPLVEVLHTSGTSDRLTSTVVRCRSRNLSGVQISKQDSHDHVCMWMCLVLKDPYTPRPKILQDTRLLAGPQLSKHHINRDLAIGSWPWLF
jgi:hypothetical protein